MKILTLILGFSTLLFQIVYGQSIESNQVNKKVVTGKITDGYGNAIVGANIFIKGTNISTISNSDGKYTIGFDTTYQFLVVSFNGYFPIEKKIEKSVDSTTIANFSIGIEAIELSGWCCTDHPASEGPHCGDNQLKLSTKFGCKKFKRDN